MTYKCNYSVKRETNTHRVRVSKANSVRSPHLTEELLEPCAFWFKDSYIGIVPAISQCYLQCCLNDSTNLIETFQFDYLD